MRVGVVVDDLMLYSRIDGAASAADATVVRVSSPSDLPADLDLVLVDWSANEPSWVEAINAVSAQARVIVFGPHTDLEAHASARAAGLGPMWARSKLVAELPALLTASTVK